MNQNLKRRLSNFPHRQVVALFEGFHFAAHTSVEMNVAPFLRDWSPLQRLLRNGFKRYLGLDLSATEIEKYRSRHDAIP
jgi:hypothetical protein